MAAEITRGQGSGPHAGAATTAQGLLCSAEAAASVDWCGPFNHSKHDSLLRALLRTTTRCRRAFASRATHARLMKETGTNKSGDGYRMDEGYRDSGTSSTHVEQKQCCLLWAMMLNQVRNDRKSGTRESGTNHVTFPGETERCSVAKRMHE